MLSLGRPRDRKRFQVTTVASGLPERVTARPGQETITLLRTAGSSRDISLSADERNQLPGHPYRLTSTADSLYIRDSSSTGNLRDNTKGAIGRNTTIRLQPRSITLPEGNPGFLTPFTFTVRRSGDLSRPSSAGWMASGLGQSPANTADFGGSLPTGTVSFAPGQSTQSTTIQIRGDHFVETHERFRLTLANPTGAALNKAVATGVIVNDDTTIQLQSKTIRLPEGNPGSSTPFTFIVRRSGNLSRSSSVDWTLEGSGVQPADRWDFDGDSFPAGRIDFAPRESTKTITINVRGDAALETDESFRLTLSNPTGGALNPNALTAEGRIRNDDNGAWIFDWSNAQSLGDTPGLLLAKLTIPSFRPGEQDLRLSALRVDLSTPGLSLISTKPISDWQANARETLTQTTRTFITSSRQQDVPVVAAINTAFFDLTDGSQAVPTNLLGFAVSGGELVSPAQAFHPFFVQDPITGARLVREPASTPDPSGVNVAFAGMSNGIVLWDGLVTGVPEPDPVLNARSGLGLSRDNRFLTLLAVDRSLRSVSGPTYWGAGIRDVGTLLAGFGSYTGLNLDGGGSTQMAWWNPARQSAQLLSTPLLDVERHVGSNLGIVYQQPLEG